MSQVKTAYAALRHLGAGHHRKLVFRWPDLKNKRQLTLYDANENPTNSKPQAEPTVNPIQGHGCCGSHADLSATGTDAAQALQNGVLDVRALAPARRHSLIFETFAGLRPGESFVLVNDHDPKPLYYQFAYEQAGAFSWQYEEQGPEVWRVRIGKTDVHAALQSPTPR